MTLDGVGCCADIGDGHHDRGGFELYSKSAAAVAVSGDHELLITIKYN